MSGVPKQRSASRPGLARADRPTGPAILRGDDLNVSMLVREAAERSLTLDLRGQNSAAEEQPFGAGRVCLQEVQPGLRCELHELAWHETRAFRFSGAPLIACHITLEGSIEGADIEDYGVVESRVNQATLIGLGEPARWKRRVRAGQFFKSFGFILQPAFFDRFAGVVKDDQLAVFEPFRAGRHVRVLPRSQRLIALGNSAFDHPYNGSLVALYQESNTLQFFLEIVRLLREENLIVHEIGRKHYDRLMDARAILDSDLIDPPKTLDLARQVGSNISALQSNFKRAFGTTIFGYIRTRRLEMARVLITEHKLGSAQAGYRVGFASPAAFTAAYRRFFGRPPSAER